RRRAAARRRTLDLGDRASPGRLDRGAPAAARRRAAAEPPARPRVAARDRPLRGRLAGGAGGAPGRARGAARPRARARRRPARRSGRGQRSDGARDAPRRPAAQRLPRRPDRAPAQAPGWAAMTTLEAVRGELAERRERLASLAVTVRESELVELLRRVDSALERLDGGTWGRCAACQGSVEADRLGGGPVVAPWLARP